MNLLIVLGRTDEAVREMRLAEKSDPLSPQLQYFLAYGLTLARHYDEAASHCEKLPADYPAKPECLGRARLGQGRIEEALRVGRPSVIAVIAAIGATSGTHTRGRGAAMKRKNWHPRLRQTHSNATGNGCAALITANKADGSGIMGYGAIDGRGGLPMLINGTPSSSTWWDLVAQANAAGLTQSRTQILYVENTNGFTLYKITLMNSPEFHVYLAGSSNFTAWGLKIIAPYDAPNTDGVDPDYTSNVTITNCFISDGDDIISVKSDSRPGANNISVVNNHFGDGHGQSIGSGTSGGVNNILFDHNSIAGNSANNNQEGIRIKSDISRGSLVQNVTYSNICMQNVHAAIDLNPFYTAGAVGNLIPQYKNITLQNVHATTEGTVQIEGHDATVPTFITLDNVQVDGIKSSDITAEYANITFGPDPVNFASLIKGTGVTVTNNVSDSNPPYTCPAAIFSPIAGELIPGPAQIAVGQMLNVTVQVFPTKEIPYQTYLANLKNNPNATLVLPAPTGTVVIHDGAITVGIGTLTGSPMLTILLSTLGPGAHLLTAAYSGDANYAGVAFGNYSLVVDAVPAIAGSGIVNTASYAAGTIAQGSLFTIFGSNLGPSAPVTAGSFPILATLGGVSVQIMQNGQHYSGWVMYASAGQVNAILPSNVPSGPAQVTVTYNGQTSAAANFTVVTTSFGVFFAATNAAIAQNYVSPSSYPVNQPPAPAKPGQIVLLWGTGLGPISAPDNVAPGAAAVDMTNVRSRSRWEVLLHNVSMPDGNRNPPRWITFISRFQPVFPSAVRCL